MGLWGSTNTEHEGMLLVLAQASTDSTGFCINYKVGLLLCGLGLQGFDERFRV